MSRRSVVSSTPAAATAGEHTALSTSSRGRPGSAPRVSMATFSRLNQSASGGSGSSSAYDIAVGVWQHKWSTDVSAVIALEPTVIVRCFYQAQRLDLVHFSNLGSGAVSKRSYNAGGDSSSLSMAWEEHDAHMERPQLTVREVGSVSLTPYIDLVRVWLRTRHRRPSAMDSSATCADRITGRSFSIHHFELESVPATSPHPSCSSSSPSVAAARPGDYLLCLLEGFPNAFVIFRIHQYQRYSFVGMGVMENPMEDSYSPTHISVFGSISTKYALAYDATTGAYVVLHLVKMVEMAMANGAPYMPPPPSATTPTPQSEPSLPKALPPPFEIEVGKLEPDWCELLWKGTPHALSTRHRFYCYNAVTGAASYESVRVTEEHADLERLLAEEEEEEEKEDDGEASNITEVVSGDEGVVAGEGSDVSTPPRPFGEFRGDETTTTNITPDREDINEDGDREEASVDAGGEECEQDATPATTARRPQHDRRMTFSPCRREVLTRRLKGSLLVPMSLEGTVGALLYSHSHATIPSGGRSTGRVPKMPPHSLKGGANGLGASDSGTSGKTVSAMLRKRVFDHQEPWSICTLLGGMVERRGGDGDGDDEDGQPHHHHTANNSTTTTTTQRTGGGDSGTKVVGGFTPPQQSTYLLTYSRTTGSVWLSRIYRIGVNGRSKGLDVSLPPVSVGPTIPLSRGPPLGGSIMMAGADPSRSLPPAPPSRLGGSSRGSRPGSGTPRQSPHRRKQSIVSSVSTEGKATPRRVRTPCSGASESGDNVVLLDEEGDSVSRPSHITTRFSSASSASRSIITVSTRAHTPRGVTNYQSIVVRGVQQDDDDFTVEPDVDEKGSDAMEESPTLANVPEANEGAVEGDEEGGGSDGDGDLEEGSSNEEEGDEVDDDSEEGEVESGEEVGEVEEKEGEDDDRDTSRLSNTDTEPRGVTKRKSGSNTSSPSRNHNNASGNEDEDALSNDASPLSKRKKKPNKKEVGVDGAEVGVSGKRRKRNKGRTTTEGEGGGGKDDAPARRRSKSTTSQEGTQQGAPHRASRRQQPGTSLTHTPSAPPKKRRHPSMDFDPDAPQRRSSEAKPWGNTGGRRNSSIFTRAHQSRFASNRGAMEEWRRYSAAKIQAVPRRESSDYDDSMDIDYNNTRQASREANRSKWQRGGPGSGSSGQQTLRPSRHHSSSSQPRFPSPRLPPTRPRVVAPDYTTGFSPRILRRYGRNIHFKAEAVDDDDVDDDDEEKEEDFWGSEEPDMQALHNWLKAPPYQGARVQPRSTPSLLERLSSRTKAMPVLSGDFNDDMETLLKAAKDAAPEVVAKAMEMLQDGLVDEDDGAAGEEDPSSQRKAPGSAWCGSARPSTYHANTFATAPPLTSPLGKFLKKQDERRQERLVASDARFTSETAEKLFKPIHTREAFIKRELAKLDKAMPRNCVDKDPEEVRKTLHKLGVQDIDIRNSNTEVRARKHAKAEAAGRQAPPKLSTEDQEALVTKMYDERTRLHRQNMERLLRLRDKKEDAQRSSSANKKRQLTTEEAREAAERLGGAGVHKRKEAVLQTILKSMDARLPPKVVMDKSDLEEVGARLHANEKPVPLSQRRPHTAA